MSNRKIRFLKKQKQEIVDQYFTETGRTRLDPTDFIEYVRTRNDHPMHHMLFGRSAEELAQEQRVEIVRNFMAGLRVSVSVTETVQEPRSEVVVSIPAYISPLADRASGGGYVRVNLDVPDHRKELARQAARDLSSWLVRHGGVCRRFGIDIEAVTDLVKTLDGFKVEDEEDATA